MQTGSDSATDARRYVMRRARAAAFATAGAVCGGRLTGRCERVCARRPAVVACAPGRGVYAPEVSAADVRVVVFGATGYIGRFVTRELARRGHRVVAFTRPRSGVGGKDSIDDVRDTFGPDVRVVVGDVTDPASVATAFEDLRTEEQEASEEAAGPPAATVVVSCLASRSGGIADSNRIDYQATLNTLLAGRDAGARHFVLLSAICVQKPLLEFQRAKLRFEEKLAKEAHADAEFSYSIVRPTAFFKSLAAQVERMRKGGSYIMFGDGALAKCNALSEADLARFMADCVSNPEKRNKILPVGGPGEPVTPMEQAKIVFRALGREEKYMSVPIGVMDFAIGVLDFLGKGIPPLRDAAEFGRIGKYYATEDMVGPRYGQDTLEDFFAKAVRDGGMEGQDLGDAKYY